MSYSQPLPVKRIDQLEAGQAFVKTRFGAPCLNMYMHVHSFDTVTEAEHVNSKCITYFKKDTLVHPLNS